MKINQETMDWLNRFTGKEKILVDSAKHRLLVSDYSDQIKFKLIGYGLEMSVHADQKDGVIDNINIYTMLDSRPWYKKLWRSKKLVMS